MDGWMNGQTDFIDPNWVTSDWSGVKSSDALALENQQKPNSSPYPLTVPFEELTLSYLTLFLTLSFSLPLPFPLGMVNVPLLLTR